MRFHTVPRNGILRRALRSALATPSVLIPREHSSRGYARDAAFDPMAFQYRMGAGFFGDVNRTHPFTIEPGPVDPTNPPLYFGQAVVIDATSKRVRRLLSSDTALTDVWGFVVRPFPIQDSGAAGAYGAQSLGGFTSVPLNQPVDVLRSGYLMTYVNGTPGKGDPVYVWVAATSGVHNQGFLEAGSTGGSTIEITGNDKTAFNGPPDANGCGEVIFNV
jgi:hypothetical protein